MQQINEIAHSIGKIQKVFIQVKLDSGLGSDDRSGINPSDFNQFLVELEGLKNIEIVGVMGVAPLGADPAPGLSSYTNFR